MKIDCEPAVDAEIAARRRMPEVCPVASDNECAAMWRRDILPTVYRVLINVSMRS